MKLTFSKYTLQFKFDAGTSRGVYKEKDSWILKIESDSILGYGEAGPLKGLSLDPLHLIEEKLFEISQKMDNLSTPRSEKEVYQLALSLAGYSYPSLRFALETAFLDILNGGKRILFYNGFSKGLIQIPINGLIWMGSINFMRTQIDEKAYQGYRCLKMKIGAINQKDEIQIIDYIRKNNPAVTLRLDANGAFSYEEAFDLLNLLASRSIHSIEQPIKAGNLEDMQRLCARSPVPIALDEELISVTALNDKTALLEKIRPQFITLKPSLLGGFAATDEWIAVAEKLKIGWWITSALESNIGLNAIAQFTTQREAESFQGLGTGMLYHNNFKSPLTVDQGYLYYDNSISWAIDTK